MAPVRPDRDRPEPFGDTVGNRPDGLVGVVYDPSGSVPPGRDRPSDRSDDPSPVNADPGDDAAELGAVTVTVASALYDFASSPAFASAVRVTFVPDAAAAVVAAPATNSELVPVSSDPRVHVALLADGHTANVGESTSATFAMLTVTVVPVLSAAVVHTKIAKLAVPPGATLLLRYA